MASELKCSHGEAAVAEQLDHDVKCNKNSGSFTVHSYVKILKKSGDKFKLCYLRFYN